MNIERDYRDLTETEYEALRQYAKEYGPKWKERLLEDWYYARQTGVLHALRNDPMWSHRGLSDFDPEAPRILSDVPAYAAPEWIKDEAGRTTGLRNEDALKWSGDKAPAAIGSEIKVLMNNLGPATVLGYFVEGNWLGMQVRLHAAPEWHSKRFANGIAYIFGADLLPARSA